MHCFPQFFRHQRNDTPELTQDLTQYYNFALDTHSFGKLVLERK